MVTAEQINSIHRLHWSEHWSVRKIARHLHLAATIFSERDDHGSAICRGLSSSDGDLYIHRKFSVAVDKNVGHARDYAIRVLVVVTVRREKPLDISGCN